MAIKSEIDMAANGEFLREFSKKYCVAVTEALSIGRVKWEIFPIGNSGKDGLVYHMKSEEMRRLCNEIASGIARKKLEADTAQYPGLYKYATGEDARMHLNIGGGNSGCRIQLQDSKGKDPKKSNYTIAVSLDALESMAWHYMLFAGLIFNVFPGSYYQSLIDTFEAGRVKRATMHSKSIDESMMTEQTQAFDDNEPMTKTPAPARTVSTSASATSVPSIPPPGEQEVFQITVLGEKKNMKDSGGIEYWLFNTNGRDKVLFKKEDAAAISWFLKMERQAKTEGVQFNIIGKKKCEGYILYESLPDEQK